MNMIHLHSQKNCSFVIDFLSIVRRPYFLHIPCRFPLFPRYCPSDSLFFSRYSLPYFLFILYIHKCYFIPVSSSFSLFLLYTPPSPSFFLSLPTSPYFTFPLLFPFLLLPLPLPLSPLSSSSTSSSPSVSRSEEQALS